MEEPECVDLVFYSRGNILDVRVAEGPATCLQRPTRAASCSRRFAPKQIGLPRLRPKHPKLPKLPERASLREK